MSYRDGQAVVREMLAGKRADALARSRALGHAQRAVLDEKAVADVEALHDRAMPFLLDEMATDEQLREAIARVDELVVAYDALLARSRTLLVAAPLPVERALAPLKGWRATSTDAQQIASELGQVLADARLLEMRPHGVAVVMSTWALLVGVEPGGDGSRHVQGQITCAIPDAVPPVRTRAERNIDDFKQHLGLAKEIETGDALFDDTCWLEGHREAALACATPAVRRALVALADFGGALDVGGGLARISWRGPARSLGDTGVPAMVVPAIEELQAAFSQ